MPNLSLRKLWRKRSVTISEKDPCYKVIYLGNVLTNWAKGEGCLDKPLSTLWRNYCQSNRSDIVMKITICGSGLQAVTREHGLTEYWAHRVTFCGAHPAYPKVFCWVYRHEGRRLKQELRCHAVLCHRSDKAQVIAGQLKERLVLALHEFRREKVVRQNARLSLMHAIYDNAALPTRKVLLSTGAANYRPPLERSKSAPKLGSIEETIEEEDEEEGDSPSDEQEERELRGACSPMGSIAISETMSDIVHYTSHPGSGGGGVGGGGVGAAGGGSELSAAFEAVLSRSPSLKLQPKHEDDVESSSLSGDLCASQLLSPNRASNSTSTSNSSTSTSCNITSSNNSSSSISHSCSTNNNSTNHLISNNNNNSNKSSIYVYSHKLTPSAKPPPILKRRFVRSISVDTSFEHDDDDFEIDDEDDDLDSSMLGKELIRLDSRRSPISTSSSRSRNSLRRQMAAEAAVAAAAAAASTAAGNSSSGAEDEEQSSLSLTSTDTTETVLDRPHTNEDTMSLMTSLSHSLNRQMSLPADAHPPPPDESLTSDQPESLGSHCDSCGSSCGGCSDGGGADGGHQHHSHQEEAELRLAGGPGGKDELLGLVVGGGSSHLANHLGNHMSNLGTLSSLVGADADEPDNISEESGYAEEKDFLQNAELAKAVNA